MFIADRQECGIYQHPGGDKITMHKEGVTNILGCHLIDGAGHWMQHEQSEKVSALLLDILKRQV